MRQQKIDILKDMITTPEDSDAGLSTVENTNNQVITAQLKSQQFLIVSRSITCFKFFKITL